MPVMSNMTLLLISVEKKEISAMTAMAPAKAPNKTEKKPEKLKLPATTRPPNHSMTTATPNPAPELTPRMEVPAKGFLKAVWSIRPHTASALPESKAVSAWGRRASQRMKCQLSWAAGRPDSISTKALKGIDTEPTARLAAKSNTTATPNKIPYFQPLPISLQSLIFIQFAKIAQSVQSA